jgi:uncharacterized protein (DUF1800 family)
VQWVSPAARLVLSVTLLGVLVPFAHANGPLKPGHIKPRDNPAQYSAFAHLLNPQQQSIHALSRLTFGPRPGDLQQLEATGVKHWVDLQLHPEQIVENPLLAEKLQPLASLGLSPREAVLHYPPPQLIAAVARGKASLPDDPELRAIVYQLAYRYLQKKGNANPNAANGDPKDPDDDPQLAPRMRIADILTPEQIKALREGPPDQRAEVLKSIPPGRRLDFVWALQPSQRKALFNIAPVELRRELILSVSPQRVVSEDLTQAKLLRAVYSNRQLEELLVDFWYNHFNVFLDKGADHYLVPAYERETIRPHVLGKFYDLLLATAKSPAMLFYLDNWQSVGPEAPQHGGNKRGLNENYGREILELHTLGVDGGYTQKDVIDVARCFTGWTIANPRKGGGFEYNDKVHDKGGKVVLGHRIAAGGGMDDGLKVLAILAHHKSTAHFISLQLAKRFVADEPPPSLVNRMAETFLKKDGDLREVMRTMLRSPEFWSQGAYRAKVKTPFEMVASELRATGADVSSAMASANEVQRLGEPLYRKIEPTGYSSANAEWVNSAALLERMNFSLALARNRVPGVKVDANEWQQAASEPIAAATLILDQPPSEQTETAIKRALANPEVVPVSGGNKPTKAAPLTSNTVLGLILGSPDFQRR